MASARQIGLFIGVWVLCLVFAPVSAFGSDEDTDQPPSTIVVSATRKPTLVQDEPLHVEAVPAEEIEENLTVQGPGGNPITDVWAPLAGRTFNLGIRAQL